MLIKGTQPKTWAKFETGERDHDNGAVGGDIDGGDLDAQISRNVSSIVKYLIVRQGFVIDIFPAVRTDAF